MMEHTLRLAINNFIVEVCADEQDYKSVQFFYDHLLFDGEGASNARVHLGSVNKKLSFFNSFLNNDGADKYWFYENLQTGFSKRVHFRVWDDSPFCIPPFIDPIFNHDIATYSGAVVKKNGKTILIIGQNYTGKTSLAYYLVNNLGWSLLADSLVMLKKKTGECLPYHSPIGLRGETRELFLKQHEIHTTAFRSTISTSTGPVLLVRAKDAMQRLVNYPTLVNEIVLLVRNIEVGFGRQIQVKIPWFEEGNSYDSKSVGAKMFSVDKFTIEQIARELNNV